MARSSVRSWPRLSRWTTRHDAPAPEFHHQRRTRSSSGAGAVSFILEAVITAAPSNAAARRRARSPRVALRRQYQRLPLPALRGVGSRPLSSCGCGLRPCTNATKANHYRRRTNMNPRIARYLMIALLLGRLAGVGVMFVFANNARQYLPATGKHWNPSTNWRWFQVMR